MAWWTKIGDEVKKHDGRQPLLSAAIHVNFAVNMGGKSVDDCGIYRRDPLKHPDEPNVLPAQLEKARKRAVRGRR